MIYTYAQLKDPKVIARFRFDPLKQEIAKRWNQMRNVENSTEIELCDIDHIDELFDEIKSLLIDCFQQDLPKEKRTPQKFNSWLGQPALAIGFTKDILTRNIWLDLLECYKLLWKEERLRLVNGEII